MTLTELREKRKGTLLAARAICDAVDGEKRDFTDEERKQVSGFMEEANKFKAQIAQAEGDANLRKMASEMGEEIEAEAAAGKARENGKSAAKPGEGKTLGERFVTAQAFNDWLKRFPNGRIPDSAKGLMSPPVEMPDLFKSLRRNGGAKDIITGGSVTSGGAFVQTDFTGIYEPLGRRTLDLMDLVANRTTASDVVEFVRQTTILDAAGQVPEASGSSGGADSGDVVGTKPEGDTAFEKVLVNVRTTAVWVPATRRSLSDAAQLRGLIDQELRADLAEKLEDQMLNGDGTGENHLGILETPNILGQAYSATVTGLDPLLETTRKAVTNLRVNGRTRPTAFVFNPADWEAIELARLAKNPQNEALAAGVPMLHGYPVVQAEALDEGTGLLGNFDKAVYWDREQASIQVSDAHADFFIRNMLAILAEQRGAFAVIRPTAFCEIDLTAGS